MLTFIFAKNKHNTNLYERKHVLEPNLATQLKGEARTEHVCGEQSFN